MLQEFKEFAMKGNVIDLAIGLVIGTAFGKIVTSLVNDVFMPILAPITGGIDFADKVYVIKVATESAEAVTLNYGLFISNIINFLIISFSIFIVVKQLNKFKRKEEKKEETKPKGPTEIELLTEIRDQLKND